MTREKEYAPFTLVVDNKFENTVPVGGAESDRVFTRGAAHRMECCANVGVKHRKLELQILQGRVRFPSVLLGVVLGDISVVD